MQRLGEHCWAYRVRALELELEDDTHAERCSDTLH
jgi:hypothetical protein